MLFSQASLSFCSEKGRNISCWSLFVKKVLSWVRHLVYPLNLQTVTRLPNLPTYEFKISTDANYWLKNVILMLIIYGFIIFITGGGMLNQSLGILLNCWSDVYPLSKQILTHDLLIDFRSVFELILLLRYQLISGQLPPCKSIRSIPIRCCTVCANKKVFEVSAGNVCSSLLYRLMKFSRRQNKSMNDLKQKAVKGKKWIWHNWLS